MANVKITALPSVSASPLSGTELLEIVQSGVSNKVTASKLAAAFSTDAANILPVANGGTGRATLTGYVKGSGTTGFTAAATIPMTDITGTATVAQGGTGAATLTGYVKGNGTSAMTAAATIPYNDITGQSFISAFSAIDQTGSVSAATAIILGTTSFSSGISITNNGSGNPTRVTFTNAGTYMLAPSIQFKNSDSNDHDVTIWFRKNGTDIANSGTVLTVPKAADGGSGFFQIVFYEQVTAGQYIEIMWLPENVAVTLDYIPAGAIAPAIPSAILSAEKIA
jgi:hypothetical protein